MKILTGNDACAEAAIAAGMNFFAGYPITPATEIAEISAELLPRVGGKFIQMEDEISSISAIIGASLSGAKAMTATSGPGFSLMQECLGYAAICEVPCVIVDVMRVGPCQGVATVPAQGDVMQARWGTHGDHPIIVLVPSTVREVYDLTVRAFNLAEKYRTPVILLSDATIAHMSEKIEVPDAAELVIVNRKRPTVTPEQYNPYADDGTGIAPLASYGDGYIWYTTGIVHDATGFPATNDPAKITEQIDRLFRKIDTNLADIVQAAEYQTEDAEVVVVAYGTVARAAQAAIKAARAEGIKAGLIRPVTLWPFPEDAINRAKPNAKRFIVCEMNHGQILGPVKELVAGSAPVDFVGQYDGRPIMPAKILSAIKGEIK
jgi:2-oxoglutarate ferredoxin oxidoreductase subunit alpha